VPSAPAAPPLAGMHALPTIGKMARGGSGGAGPQPFACSVCDRRFNDSSSRARHMLVHTGDKPYLCRLCGARFRQRPHLYAHLRRHTGEKPYACGVCGQRFTESGTRKAHQQRHGLRNELPDAPGRLGQPPPPPPPLPPPPPPHAAAPALLEDAFMCVMCGLRLLGSKDLLEHAQAHTAAQLFPCRVCGQPFGDGREAQRHVWEHAVPRAPSVCCVCGTWFADSGSLSHHARLFAQERPLACAVCGQRFCAAGDANRHTRVHVLVRWWCAGLNRGAGAGGGGGSSSEQLASRKVSML
jgi:KRAB domain-containing zinc finger protein